MVNLLLRSVLVLALLFGLLFAVGTVYIVYSDGSIWLAVAFAVGVVLLQYLLGPYIIQLLYKIEWRSLSSVEPSLAEFVTRVCSDNNLPEPRFGIIQDGNPNAFTFGHYPGNARVVVTSGLLDKLDQNESQAVFAHELGHIAHWDFVVMTLASAIPLIMYMIWLFGRRFSSGSRRSGGIAILIAFSAFLAYIVSQYIVMFLSRVREYYADAFAARVTGDPGSLSSALVKIAYGLASSVKDEKDKQANVRMAGVRAIGIFDTNVANNLALASAGSGSPTLNGMIDAMKWDLWNPWGLIYELKSTHPLPAKRIRALDKIGVRPGLSPHMIDDTKKPESYWDEFLVDLFISYLPLIVLLGSLIAALFVGLFSGGRVALGSILLLPGLAWWLKRQFSYRKGFEVERSVSSLVGEVKVSAVRCIPCTLKGQIIGRGIPGLFYSEDLVLQDDTGFIIVDYRQPIRFIEFLFGLAKAESFIGRRATITGWYRRSPRPYFEMRKATFEDGETITSYFYPFRQFLVYALIAGGLILVISGIAGF